jgi:hypothetical protein
MTLAPRQESARRLECVPPIHSQTAGIDYISQWLTLLRGAPEIIRKAPSFSKKLDNHVGAI